MTQVFVNILARRYADALLQAAQAKGAAQAVQKDMRDVSRLFDQVEELKATLKNPALPLEQRMDLITKIARAARLNTITMNLLKLLLQNNRLGLINAIAVGYTEALDRANGWVRARVITAKPLSMFPTTRLSDAIKRKLGVKRVIVEKVVDPKVLGGLKVVTGDRVFDMTIQGYIEALKTRLLGG